MAGRKGQGEDYGQWIRLRRPEIQVSAIKPNVAHRFFDTYEEDLSEIKKRLEFEGFKKIKAEQSSFFLMPRLCPLCCQSGRPVLNPYRRTKSQRNTNSKNQPMRRFVIHYNHSKPKKRQCFIGYYIAGMMQLSRKIDYKKLHPSHGPYSFYYKPRLKRIKFL